MRHFRGWSTFAALVAAAVTLAAASAGAAPEAADLKISLAATDFLQERVAPVPNGGTATVTSTNFKAYVLIASGTVRAKIRAELGEGLRWGADDPDPSEYCTSTATTAQCETSGVPGDEGWNWDIVAAQYGSYPFKATIVEASEPDPEPSNNATSITIVVKQPVVSVSASAVTLTPAKPKAGSAVAATVRVTAGGSPVRPIGLTCTGAIGTSKIMGKGRAASGSATCVYRTPRSAKGKALRGAISFSAQGRKFTRRFSAKLG